jgi:hypothetical protein
MQPKEAWKERASLLLTKQLSAALRWCEESERVVEERLSGGGGTVKRSSLGLNFFEAG